MLSYGSGGHSFWLIPLGILFFVIYALVFSRLLEYAPLSLPSKPIAEDLPQLAAVAPTDPQMLQKLVNAVKRSPDEKSK